MLPLSWRRARHDDENHGEIVQALEAAGRDCYELDGAKRDHPGITDLLVVWGGGLVMMEIKSIRRRAKDGGGEGSPGKLNPAQKAFHDSWRGPRGSLVTVWTAAEALAATGVYV